MALPSHLGLLFLATASIAGAQTLIDVSFPNGTGTNATFLEIDNGVGGGENSWTQTTGVLYSTTANNSTAGAASETTIDFTTLGDDTLVLSAEIDSVTGGLIANGIFIGFQRRINEGTGADLWNNLPPSFGLVIPGSGNVAGGVRNVAVGGNAGAGRYQEPIGYGIVTLASIQDGFNTVLTVNSAGWEIEITGLEDADANPIIGGSGTWGIDGIHAWTDFVSDMRVGFSYQTPAAGGNFIVSKLSLSNGAPNAGPLFQILSVELDDNPEDPGTTITWASAPDAIYGIEYSTDLENWPEIDDSVESEGETTAFIHKFLPSFPQLQDTPRVYYRIRSN